MENKIKAIIAEELGVKLRELVPEARIIEDLGADSLDIVEMIMVLEEELDIEIPDPDAEKLTTVKDVLIYCTAKTTR